MTDISLIQYARLLGSNTVIGMAEKVGLTRPPPPISVHNLVALAGRMIVPFAPVDLQPQNGAQDISNNPDLFFRDPEAGTPAAAGQFQFIVTQNDVIVDPSHKLTGAAVTPSPLTPPNIKWLFPLPPGEVTLTVWGQNKAGTGPASSSTFTVVGLPPPPPEVKPSIAVSSSGSGQGSVFVVTGSAFLPNKDVRIRVVDDLGNERDFHQSADGVGNLNTRLGVPCNSGLELHFSATDGRSDPSDLTGFLWSNTFNVPCP
ncbi:MAG: hypothetical protein JO076_07390 [Verrucomicrobia bacterium]|nr:hypothetical protein [Verrucomicrobiota bacterium]